MTNRAYLLPDIEPSIALTQAACSEVEYQKQRFVDDAGVVPVEATRTGLIAAPLKAFARLAQGRDLAADVSKGGTRSSRPPYTCMLIQSRPAECPELALLGPTDCRQQSPLMGVKRTTFAQSEFFAF